MLHDIAGTVCFGRPSGPFKWVSEEDRLEVGAERYMAHAQQQMADGLMDRAGCSLLKASHKARQLRALRKWKAEMWAEFA